MRARHASNSAAAANCGLGEPHLVEGISPEILREYAQLPALLNRNQLARELNVSLRMVDKLQLEGMPCIYVGRVRRFIFTEVVAWLKRKGAR